MNNENTSTEINLNNLMVVSPRDKVPLGFTTINTTSRDTGSLGKQLSPFFLSGIPIYEGIVTKNLENAWQFSKVYSEFADDNKNPTEDYFKWAKKGWSDNYAHRYANGKGNIPLYSFWKTYNQEKNMWEEHKWDYVTARKNIYFPLYAKAIIKTKAFAELKNRLNAGEKIALWDFDGYDHASRKMTYEDVVNTPKYKCGHAFVLYGLLIGQLKVINDQLIYDFKNEIKIEDTPTDHNIAKPILKENKYTCFFQSTSPFSQSHPSLFVYQELIFICAEQFILYAKARTFSAHDIANKIINIENYFIEEDGTFETLKNQHCYDLIMAFKTSKISREEIINNVDNLSSWKEVQTAIKNVGRQISNYKEEVWIAKRLPIAYIANKEKYNQNEDLKQLLINTHDSIMVEASPFDKVWGSGLNEEATIKISTEKWPGLNLLGNLLNNLKIHYLNLVEK